MDERNFGHLGTSFQQGLLKTIIEDKKFAVTIVDVVESKYFDGPYFKYIMENIKELYKLYGCIPDYNTLQQKIMKENKDISGKINLDTLKTIQDMNLENSGYIKDTSLNFCKQQVLKKSLKQVEEIMNNGDFENYHKIEGIIQTALQIGVTTDNIVDIFDNVRASLQDDNRIPYPTGITGIDNLLKGGLAKGELGILLAPLGVGKTTFLTKVANTAYNVGGNVLHLFFEDNLKDIRKKHYTCWTHYSDTEQKDHEDEVVSIVEEKQNTKHFLKLMKLPAFGVSVDNIKSVVRKLASEGQYIDVLIIDYVDCISMEKSIAGEEWKGEGTIMRSLEAMKDEFNIAIWTATQGNRESISSEVVTTDQMGGSIKKAQIGHVVISVGKTLEQKEHNLATVTLLKSRIGKDGIVFQNCKFNNEYLEIDTETQNTLLGHEEEKSAKKKDHAAEVYKMDQERKSHVRQQVEADIDNLLVKKDEIMSKINNLEQTETILKTIGENFDIPVHVPPPPPGVGILSAVGTVDIEPIVEKPPELSQDEKARQRLKELANQKRIAKEKLRIRELVDNTV
jgi:replicative DNA helicase